MKLPRDVSGEALARALARFGYEVTRQTGSHLRLTRSVRSTHHLTVPRHRDLKVGTLAGILKEVAEELGLSRDELADRLWS